MEMIELARVIKEVGLSVGVFCLCAWIVMFIVKKMAVTLDKLCSSIDKHETEADIRAKYVREEHRQMIETLGRINGYNKKG